MGYVVDEDTMSACAHPFVSILVEANAEDIVVGNRIWNFGDVKRVRIDGEELALAVTNVDDTILRLLQHSCVVLVAWNRYLGHESVNDVAGSHGDADQSHIGLAHPNVAASVFVDGEKRVGGDGAARGVGCVVDGFARVGVLHVQSVELRHGPFVAFAVDERLLGVIAFIDIVLVDFMHHFGT